MDFESGVTSERYWRRSCVNIYVRHFGASGPAQYDIIVRADRYIATVAVNV